MNKTRSDSKKSASVKQPTIPAEPAAVANPTKPNYTPWIIIGVSIFVFFVGLIALGFFAVNRLADRLDPTKQVINQTKQIRDNIKNNAEFDGWREKVDGVVQEFETEVGKVRLAGVVNEVDGKDFVVAGSGNRVRVATDESTRIVNAPDGIRVDDSVLVVGEKDAEGILLAKTVFVYTNRQ